MLSDRDTNVSVYLVKHGYLLPELCVLAEP